ncbi:MAG: branched-chain alpha-keto acid dehydrogenase subunit [Nocardioidaceae bacterium]|nr:branched-chain alpha-keto acid dehydrogenase subunit [Nocardioidaceae bacterium]
MSDAQQFRLPDVGEGLTEAEVVSWRVQPGDTVAVNDVVVEIETAKSLVELPCPFAGTVTELLVPEGTTVAVGTPLIEVSSGAAAEVDPARAPDDEAPPGDQATATPPESGAVEPGLIGGAAPGGRTSVLVGYGPRTTEAKRRPRKASAVPPAPAAAAAQQSVQSAFSTAADKPPETAVDDADPEAAAADEVRARQPSTAAAPVRSRALAKPPVRKLAKDLGIDLAAVAPTGDGGIVTRADVEAVAAGGPAAPVSPGTGAETRIGEETRVSVKGVRKRTAEAMVSSAFTAPHVTEWVTVDVSRTMRLVRRLRQNRDFRDAKVSPLLIVAKAVCLAVRRTPEMNASWDEAAQEIVLKRDVNLGIAAATPRGLLVPNVRRADQMGLRELADALSELTATARDGRTQPAAMSGGTFTITNVGVFGIDAGTPILNPGETGILCIGAISRRPWVVGDEVRPRWVTTLAVSFDHRVVDGQQGSRFLSDVAAILHDPASALAL